MDDRILEGEHPDRSNPGRTEGGSTTRGSTDDTVAGHASESHAAAVPPNTDTDMAGSRPGEEPRDT